MKFASRADAGQKLGIYLEKAGVHADLVLGLPRGGVVVAAEVARILNCPLDVLVVRKIGHPAFREFAIGALSEGDVTVFDAEVLNRFPAQESQVEAIIGEEKRRLEENRKKFSRANLPARQGRTLVLVDDGLATGATLEAAARSAHQQGAGHLIVAVPVASSSGARRIQQVCNEFHAIQVDPSFQAVGQYYDSFGQTTDEEVQRILGI